MKTNRITYLIKIKSGYKLSKHVKSLMSVEVNYMYHIAICDEDIEYIRFLEQIVLETKIKSEDVKFFCYTSGKALLENVETNKEYDLLILDIQMSQKKGYEIAKCYRQRCPHTVLVYCSHKYSPTEEIFKTQPYRYLLKQYTEDKMANEMSSILEYVYQKRDKVCVIGHYYDSVIKLYPDEIMYIALAKHGSKIYLAGNIRKYDYEDKLKSKEKISELYIRLKDCGFVYAHNSYLVNLKYVKRIKKKPPTELELEDGTILTVARSKEKNLRNKFIEVYEKRCM